MTFGSLVRRAAFALAVAGASCLASPVAACPACAGGGRGNTGVAIALGTMIVIPFAIVALAWPAIKRGPERP